MQKELEREKQNRRKSEQSYVSTIKARGRRVASDAGASDAGASDADDDDDGDSDEDEQEAMGANQLDSDSEEEESDTEWLAWMTDLPRQFLVQQSQMTPTSPTSPVYNTEVGISHSLSNLAYRLIFMSIGSDMRE